MPITSPGNDDDTGENHQPTLRKNTAEPVEQTLKQNNAASVHLLVFDSDNDAPNRPGSSAQLASRSQPIQPSQNHPVATCRFYADPDHPDQPGRYIIARLAVLPEAQGRHIGSRLLADAERRIAQAGGTMAAVHSENDHYKFYEQCGYRLTDEVYEGGRHGWLIKDLILGSEN